MRQDKMEALIAAPNMVGRRMRQGAAGHGMGEQKEA